MLRKLVFLPLLLAAQPTHFLAELHQRYVVSSSPGSSPDSVDISVILNRIDPAVIETLASSNFPFYYNTALLNMHAARAIHLNRFHDNAYYRPILWSVSAGRVNVTVSRLPNPNPSYSHTVKPNDTIIVLRAPLRTCGDIASILEWDSVSAAVLNHSLQNLKPRIDWISRDTLRLCPLEPTRPQISFNIPSSVRICAGDSTQLFFQVTSSSVPPSSAFAVLLQDITTGTSKLIPVGGSSLPYSFYVVFPAPAPPSQYRLSILERSARCNCHRVLKDTLITAGIQPRMSLYPIGGPDSVFPGNYSYYLAGIGSSLPPGFSSLWLYRQEGASSATPISPMDVAQVTVTILPSPSLRADTIAVVYSTPTLCSQLSRKIIFVRPCPGTGGQVSGVPDTLCEGERATFQLTNLPARPDSIQWQRWDGSSWQNIPGERNFAYITPALAQGLYSYRAIVYFGSCAAPSAPDSVRVLPAVANVPIAGKDTVYVGGTYTYTFPASFSQGSWTYIPQGGTSQSLGSSASVLITFTQPPNPPRTDTLRFTYRVGGSCERTADKWIRVLPCPTTLPRPTANPRSICLGQRSTLELQVVSSPDSVRWQSYDGANWVDVPLNEGVGASSLTYLTPPLRSQRIYRLRAHYGPCRLESPAETVFVSPTFLSREFYGLRSPACVGDTVPLRAEGRGVWYTPNGRGQFTSPNDPTGAYIPSPADPPTVQICWVIRPEDIGECRDQSKDSICLLLNVNPTDAQGAFAISVDTICVGEFLILMGTITSGTRGFWQSNGSGVFYPSNDSPQAIYIPFDDDRGRKVGISWTVVGSCGRAIYTDSVFVKDYQVPRIKGPNKVCANVPLVLEVFPYRPGDTVIWFRASLERAGQAGPPDSTNPYYLAMGRSVQFLNLPIGPDTVCIYSVSGGCRGYDELAFEVLPAPVAAFEVSPRLTTMNNPTISFTSRSQGATRYTWNFGDPNRPDIDSVPNPRFSYSAPGVYTVVLYVQNDLGCSDFFVCTNCIQVLKRQVYLPTAFSPNGDGVNDVFRPLPLEENFRFYRLEVYDRWGQLVFEGNDVREWRGEAKNGQILDPGTYSYKAIIRVPDEGLVVYTGVVHLVR
ncbi:MAG: gliding motility-associated C-terminal domain-containing protein [Bacteroidia bacterium]|nr:gliding motility-associated C-terminal domain-containing protein [Bacteroidia bacterium]MDW8235083.1 gliding motility-associated C-terminal domain-containing protein [Bacteroidia bacterium]